MITHLWARNWSQSGCPARGNGEVNARSAISDIDWMSMGHHAEISRVVKKQNKLWSTIAFMFVTSVLHSLFRLPFTLDHLSSTYFSSFISSLPPLLTWHLICYQSQTLLLILTLGPPMDSPLLFLLKGPVYVTSLKKLPLIWALCWSHHSIRSLFPMFHSILRMPPHCNNGLFICLSC